MKLIDPKKSLLKKSKAELVSYIRELEEEIDDLQDTLDKIADLAEGPEESDEEGTDSQPKDINVAPVDRRLRS